MTVAVQPLHPLFTAELLGVDLREDLAPGDIAKIESAMDQYAVVVFRNQALSDEQQLAFAKRLGTPEAAVSGLRKRHKARLEMIELVDVSNLDEGGAAFEAHDARRMRGLGNRLWHTDSSFREPRGKYSILSGRIVPPEAGETEYADLRSAYDALPSQLKDQLEGLLGSHVHTWSREQLGFHTFEPEEVAALPPVEHPIVSILSGSKRRTLYLASHISHIVGLPVPEGRMLLRDLIEFATQPQFVYRHSWRQHDVVMWDNRCTMHRRRPFDESERRDLRRVTTLDVPADRIS